jgi:Mannosyl-glycoprotein endo-beta-N-acetylglucosaminidase
MGINLKDGVKARAKNAVVGGAAGYLKGAKKAEDQGAGPGRQVLSGLRAGATGAANRSKWAARNAPRNSSGPIPTQDLRSGANAAKGLSNFVRNPTKAGANGAKNAFKKLTGRNNAKDQQARSGARKVADKVKEKANQAVKKVRRRVRNELEKKAVLAAAETGGLSLLTFAATRYKTTFYIIAGVVLFFILLFISGDSSAVSLSNNYLTAIQNQDQNTEPTTTDTCEPAQFTGDSFGKTSVCTITVTYTGSADDIIVTDTPLPGEAFVSAGQGGTYDSATNTVTWDAKKLKLQLNPVNFSVSVTFRITTHQINLSVHDAYAINPTGLTSGGGGSVTACTVKGSTASEAKWQQVLTMGKQYGSTWIGFLNDARSIASQQDYPLAVIIGQGALESAHGTSNFARTRNNFFGFNALTNDPNQAKSYPNAAASILDYVKLIKGGNGGSNQLYLQAYANRADPVKMVELIRAGGYATDPNYVTEVTSIPEFQVLTGITLPCN